MTATTTPTRPPATAHRSPALSYLRLLRIELRRSPMLLIAPLIAGLFWFDSYRPSTSQQPLFVLRTFWNMGQGHTIIDFGPIVAGMAAWIGARDGRRGTADLITTMTRSRWTARLAAHTAAAVWAAVMYVVAVGALFGVYAHQGVTGTPPWWWAGVGLAAVIAFTSFGYAVGALFPSQFAAPVAAFAGFLALMMSSQTSFRSYSGWALILPTNSNGNFQLDSGTFYPYLRDLPVARILFFAGILVATLGLLGAAARSDGRRLRQVAAAITALGVALSGTAVGLAATGRLRPHGIVIPALHDAAQDRDLAYTPVCAPAGGAQVCLNPAYARFLTSVTAGLTPALAEVSGLPGAPARIDQVGALYNGSDAGLAGTPPVVHLDLRGVQGFVPGRTGLSSAPTSAAQFNGLLQLRFARTFVGVTGHPTALGTPAQQAVVAELLHGLGIPYADQPALLTLGEPGRAPTPATGQVYPAAQRLAALSAAGRTAWLSANLPALRAGTLTLEQLP
ncbi:hypothetical protein [Actinoplanes sp. NPDC051411]|uniref:hypothetical protein n=1 Tax=Actinoplanes sp. NPDC051411 TaxID=3155522 RepID=UPI0034215E79